MPKSAGPTGKRGRLSERIARHGLSARKKLGQHFILDINLTRRIARSAGNLNGKTVVEVGPGPGGLTEALLETEASRIIAVERDRRCIEALQDLVADAPDRLHLIEADARTVSIRDIAGGNAVIIANLPYNIATFLLLQWFEKIDAILHMVLMFQKEVAERLTARPGEKAYGRLSILTQWRCEVRKLFDVPARAFTPPPNVDSRVVSLTPYDKPPYPADAVSLSRVTAAAFGQRRKMLRGSLKTLGPDSSALIEAAGLDPARRAETLDIGEFCALANALQSKEGH